ncbi:hypothetical protein [Streptomyces sp. NPDC051183]|uniref:hypothetical protein n=1 Tax=unclassified Streptomyces TaxID=2593676 RepID=UPI00342A68CC
MRIRSAVTASALAVGILLGGAGASLANDGLDIEGFKGGHAAASSDCSSFAAVPATKPGYTGPTYAAHCATDSNKEWAAGFHLGAH